MTLVYSHAACQPHGTGTTAAGVTPQTTCDKTKEKQESQSPARRPGARRPLLPGELRKPVLHVGRARSVAQRGAAPVRDTVSLAEEGGPGQLRLLESQAGAPGSARQGPPESEPCRLPTRSSVALVDGGRDP